MLQVSQQECDNAILAQVWQQKHFYVQLELELDCHQSPSDTALQLDQKNALRLVKLESTTQKMTKLRL